MAGTIDKGTIASINAAKQTASVMTPTGIVTTGLVIPWHLRTSTGQLKKGMEVIFVIFEDSTGLILSRTDGEWGQYLPRLTIGTVLSAGTDVIIGDLSVVSHTHQHSWTDGAGSGETSAPK